MHRIWELSCTECIIHFYVRILQAKRNVRYLSLSLLECLCFGSIQSTSKHYNPHLICYSKWESIRRFPKSCRLQCTLASAHQLHQQSICTTHFMQQQHLNWTLDTITCATFLQRSTSSCSVSCLQKFAQFREPTSNLSGIVCRFHWGCG